MPIGVACDRRAERRPTLAGRWIASMPLGVLSRTPPVFATASAFSSAREVTSRSCCVTNATMPTVRSQSGYAQRGLREKRNETISLSVDKPSPPPGWLGRLRPERRGLRVEFLPGTDALDVIENATREEIHANTCALPSPIKPACQAARAQPLRAVVVNWQLADVLLMFAHMPYSKVILGRPLRDPPRGPASEQCAARPMRRLRPCLAVRNPPTARALLPVRAAGGRSAERRAARSAGPRRHWLARVQGVAGEVAGRTFRHAAAAPRQRSSRTSSRPAPCARRRSGECRPTPRPFCMRGMLRGQFGKMSDRGDADHPLCALELGQKRIVEDDLAVPFTRSRFGLSSMAMNSRPTCGLARMFPRLLNIPLPS